MTLGLRCCVVCMTLPIAACSSLSVGGFIDSPNARPVPMRTDRNTLAQLAKSDIDRMADIEYAESLQSLKILMLKLYKRNPGELAKSGLGSAEQTVSIVLDASFPHAQQFAALEGAQGTRAIMRAFNEHYTGDRVLALIYGIQTMLFQAHGNKTEFLFTDKIEPQNLYNAARNIEIAVWKLSSAKNSHGQLILLTNDVQGEVQNLSFEREFGKIIARTDLLALTLAEKSQRLISRLTQSITTANFLPF